MPNDDDARVTLGHRFLLVHTVWLRKGPKLGLFLGGIGISICRLQHGAFHLSGDFDCHRSSVTGHVGIVTPHKPWLPCLSPTQKAEALRTEPPPKLSTIPQPPPSLTLVIEPRASTLSCIPSPPLFFSYCEKGSQEVSEFPRLSSSLFQPPRILELQVCTTTSITSKAPFWCVRD